MNSAAPASAAVAQFLGSLDEAFEPGHHDRLEERLLGGEMTVDGADTNPRSAGHLVDRHRQALRREDLLRRFEDLREVTDGIGPRACLGSGHLRALARHGARRRRALPLVGRGRRHST